MLYLLLLKVCTRLQNKYSNDVYISQSSSYSMIVGVCLSLHTINGSGDGSEHGKSEGLLIGSI